MFCPNCGTKLDDDARFCTSCGANVAAFTNPGGADSMQNSYSPYSAAGSGSARAASDRIRNRRSRRPANTSLRRGQNSRRSGDAGKALGGILTAAVILIAATSLVAFAGKRVVNTVESLVLSPEKYYQAIEKNYCKDMIKTAGCIYGDYFRDSACVYDHTYQVELEGEVTDELQTVLAMVRPGQDISWVKKVKASAEISSRDDVLSAVADIALNGEDIASGKVIADLDEHAVYATVPVLSSEYVKVPVSSASMGEQDVENLMYYGLDYVSDVNDFGDIRLPDMGQLKELAESLPDKVKMIELANRYADLILGEMDNVDKNRTMLHVGSVEQKVTGLKVRITYQDLKDIADRLNDELSQDSELQRLLYNVTSSDSLYNDLCREISYFREDAQYYLVNRGASTTALTMYLYVDGKGEVRGRALADHDDEVRMIWSNPEHNGKTALQAGMRDYYGGDYQFSGIEGVGTKSLGKVDMDLTIKEYGRELGKVRLTNWDTNSWKNGHFSGTLNFDLSTGFGSATPVGEIASRASNMLELYTECKFDIQAKDMDITLKESLKDKELGTVRVRFKQGSGKKTNVERNASVYEVRNVTDWQNFYDHVDPSELINNLEDAGASGVLVSRDTYDWILKLAFLRLW